MLVSAARSRPALTARPWCRPVGWPSDATIIAFSDRAECSMGNRQGSAMHVGGVGQRRTEALTVFMDAPRHGPLPLRRCPGETPRPSLCDVGKKPGAGFIRRRCESAAEQIRSSAGVAHYESGKECSAGKDTPWPRLLLWVFACTALLVSLIIRADGLDDRDPGLAVRAAAVQRSSATDLPVFRSTVQSGEAGALSRTSGPKI